MCARFTLATNDRTIQLRFHAILEGLALTERYNTAPTQNVLAIIERDGAHRAGFLRWGLVPSWAKDPSIGQKLLNARAETLGEKPSFRQAFAKRRCLIPADGFYEWCKEGSKRIPMRFVLKSGEAFAFAGLWESWRQPDGEMLSTCTIITTAPNDLVAPVHDRMPVILAPDAEGVWLDTSVTDAALLRSLLAPYPAAALRAYEVAPIVNSPRTDTAACIAPAG